MIDNPVLNLYHQIFIRKEVIEMYTVYQHKNKINGKNYFGITSRNPVERWRKDGSGYKTSPHFYSAI
jgi:hypothetical protein